MTTRLLQRTMVIVILTASMPVGRSLLTVTQASASSDPTATVNERVSAIVDSLKESKTKLRQYEWFQTTTVTVDGEQKMRKQDRCYYGEDGVLQKVTVSATDPPKKKFGLRGRIAAKKQAEMQEFMEQAVSMTHLYVPPDPRRLRLVRENGGVSFTILEPGKRIRIDFHNYRLPQDTLGMELDVKTNRLLRLVISSYVGTPDDAFTSHAKFASLKDGTTYLAETVLEVKEKDLKASIKNTGYRKMASAGSN